MRPYIAMVMAFVAMCGAVAAFQAALKEHETSRLDRKLNQGQLLELTSRQVALDRDSTFHQLDDRYQQDVREGNYFQQQAAELRPKDPARAANFDLKAQEEFAAARAIRPFRDYVYVETGKSSLESTAEKQAARDLIDLGFEVEPPEDTGPRAEPKSMWGGLKESIVSAESKVVELAFAAVIFVCSLALFTFAQLVKPRSRAERSLEYLGFAFALGALLFTLAVEHSSWSNFAGAGLAFAILGYVGWRFSLKIPYLRAEDDGKETPEKHLSRSGEEPIHPGELDPLLFAGLRIHLADAKHYFTRVIIVLIACTALLSVVCAYWYSESARNASEAARGALDSQVQLFKSSTRPASATFYVMGTLATTQEIHARYEAARQRAQLAEEAVPGVNIQESLAQLSLLKELFVKQPKQNLSILFGPWGPDKDPRFPNKWVTESLIQAADEDYGQWDARNELSIAWHRKATMELATITLFAIALYLFGQSLGMGQTHAAFMLVFFSACLVFMGAVSAVYVILKPLPNRPQTISAECKIPGAKDGKVDPADEAAKDFAAGKKILATALRPEEYARAKKKFVCAVEARPNFALANYFLARAAWMEGTPQKGEGYISLTTKEALPDILSHQRKSLETLDKEGFSRPLTMLGNHGFDNVLLALSTHDRKHLKEAIKSTQTAIGKDNNAPWLQFNLGLAYLAANQKEDGLKAYEDGLKLPFDENLAAGSITDLEILQEHCKGLNDAAYCSQVETEIAKLKSRFAAVWNQSPGAAANTGQSAGSGSARISNISLEITPSGVGWHANLSDVNLDQDVLIVLWYAHDDDWNVWRVVPAASGRVYPVEVWDDGTGRKFAFNSYLDYTNHHECLSGGDYRAEFYLNNRLAAMRKITLARNPAFDAVGFRDINMSMCYPKGWVPWHPKDGTNQGLVKGFTDPLGGGGAFLFTYYYPKSGSGAVSPYRLFQRSIAYLVEKKVMAQEQFSQPTPDACGMYPPNYRMVHTKFIGTTTNMLASSWTERDGLIHFAIIYRRPSATTGFIGSDKARRMEDEDCGTLLSFTSVYGPLE